MLRSLGGHLQELPVLGVIVNYIRRSYKNDPVHTALEIVVLIWAIRYAFSKDRKRSPGAEDKLTEKVA